MCIHNFLFTYENFLLKGGDVYMDKNYVHLHPLFFFFKNTTNIYIEFQ